MNRKTNSEQVAALDFADQWARESGADATPYQPPAERERADQGDAEPATPGETINGADFYAAWLAEQEGGGE